MGEMCVRTKAIMKLHLYLHGHRKTALYLGHPGSRRQQTINEELGGNCQFAYTRRYSVRSGGRVSLGSVCLLIITNTAHNDPNVFGRPQTASDIELETCLDSTAGGTSEISRAALDR